MVATKFPSRLLFDKSFYEFGKTYKISPRIPVMLMKISTESRPYKRCHNVMSKKIFDTILKNSNISREFLRIWYYPIDIEEYENIEDEIERNIKLAIELSEEFPEVTHIIVGDEETKNKYEDNPHFKNVSTISVLCGDKAVNLIKNYFEICTEK
jgi:hypothetical protein